MKRRDVVIGLAVAIILAAFSFLSSKFPDGLERTIGINAEKNTSPIIGIFAVVIVFLLAITLGRLLRNKK
ncbi:MAG: hypothetical protein PHY94_04795 [Candidatus Omnitrophica bacterium]|nr:hypothetical protein [Candidatus Omnitrophota bacterium]